MCLGTAPANGTFITARFSQHRVPGSVQPSRRSLGLRPAGAAYWDEAWPGTAGFTGDRNFLVLSLKFTRSDWPRNKIDKQVVDTQKSVPLGATTGSAAR